MNFDTLSPQAALTILFIGLFCIAWIDIDLKRRQK